MASFELLEPGSLEEAFDLLDPDDPAVRPIGGGTALMLMMKAQIYRPERLVSLRRINGRFSGIDFAPGRGAFRIGAMTTFAELEHSPDIRCALPVIPQTMLTLANVRVRNVATVGGNLAHADPHLDLPPVWAALGARATIVGPSGERTVPVEEIAAGYYETTLANNELLAELEVPARPGWRSLYVKVTTRAAHDWPALGLALSMSIEGRTVRDLRLFMSAAVDRPTRLSAAEGVLRGADVGEAVIRAAGEAAVAETEIEADSRGSAPYKQHLLRVHLGRAVRALAGE
ncbi:FAD binding domain-containing protein [Faunimonas sp. B44]|uniref:FAD binding domain-containing protein n=1 Tax=Faunimonas sp. B44 TaxID=3461493 RepID=UPI0040448309